MMVHNNMNLILNGHSSISGLYESLSVRSESAKEEMDFKMAILTVVSGGIIILILVFWLIWLWRDT